MMEKLVVKYMKVCESVNVLESGYTTNLIDKHEKHGVATIVV